MTSQLEKEFLIVGVIAGAFIALFYDLFQDLLHIVFPPSVDPLIKVLSCFLTIIASLLILKRYLKSIKKCENDRNPPPSSKTPNKDDDSKKTLAKYVRSEMVNLFILSFAGVALTFGAASTDIVSRFIGSFIAAGLFIWAILRRAKSTNAIETKITGLRKDIDDLKEQIRKSNNNPKQDNQ